MTGDRIGLVPVPDDNDLTGFLRKMIENDTEMCNDHLSDLTDTISDTASRSEPREFAYAKMVNFLSEGIEFKDLVHTCAAAMWAIAEIAETTEPATLLPVEPTD